ncbi:glycosyltransferase family 2 protein [Paenibacillus macerans]|uniref:glycosyltransferase family 2 protein n=1 Tax=Paenibacillus macerans TaxID=44252 RepID=UPI000EE68FCC|nr:glycosyltransferase family 2 protein [Paenibacillus macerans]GBK65192.1 glycosyltransferase family 2 protein [Paenibacillus macerans]GBK71429.1 glycosyltransferase family 2 protein [Paenibacillus macerans]
MGKKKVQVLLSTYNGEKYLDELLKSVLSQDGVEINMLIRDDGSVDNTTASLLSYSKDHPNKIRFIKGSNLGVQSSFFELIKEASEDYDYYAFCDQDDVWESNKLLRAVTLLHEQSEEIPLMYCSATSMVDEKLNFIGTWPSPPRRPMSMYNALIENIAVGCTLVMNHKTMRLLKSSFPRTVSNVIMHDWWVYLCVSTFGKVIFDDEAHLLYRQHTDNVLGGQSTGTLKKWCRRIIRFISGKNKSIISNQASEFIQTYCHILSHNQKQEIERLLACRHNNIVNRFLYILNTPFYRQAWIDNIVFKIVYMAGRI